MEIAATSTEYVHIPVAATVNGVSVDLGTPPKVAFLTGAANPADADWLSGEWSDGTARILIGPEGGATELDPGTYWTWVTWSAGDEVPVYRAGRTRIY